jgi:hypothetical protein
LTRTIVSVVVLCLVACAAWGCQTSSPHRFTVTSDIGTTDATVDDQTGWVRPRGSLINPIPEWALATQLPHVRVQNVTDASVDVRWVRGDCEQAAWVEVAGDSPDALRISVYPGDRCMEDIAGYGVLRLTFDRPIDASKITTVELDGKPED